MEDFTLIAFKVTDEFLGVPNPYIPDGVVVILIQDGKVEIGRYNEPSIKEQMPSIIHPDKSSDNLDLTEQLLNMIKEKLPQYLASEMAVVLTCPNSILEKVKW